MRVNDPSTTDGSRVSAIPAGLRPLVPRARIAARIRALARRIRRDYAGRDLVVVGVLTGAFVFVADLVRALGRPLTVDFVGLASYGRRTVSSGSVRVTKPLGVPIRGRDVLVVDDILDTGRSLRRLLDTLAARRPRSLRVCVLLDKRGRRVEHVRPDYVGFVVGDHFVVGYGIDHAGRYRWLPGLWTLGPRNGPHTPIARSAPGYPGRSSSSRSDSLPRLRLGSPTPRCSQESAR